MDKNQPPSSGPQEKRELLTQLPAGTVVAGRFTLESLAGAGDLGAVYCAADSLSGQRVALKLLPPALTQEARQRLAREAELLATLRHPGIASYVAHGVTSEHQAFFATEWLEGENLAQRLVREPLSLSETLVLMRRAALALAAAHRHGLVHRDIKPSNLFLRAGRVEEVVLLDFGPAHNPLLTPSMSSSSHVVLEALGYMAPEQTAGEGAPAPSADIFSLGCVLYQCLTGKPPFREPRFSSLLGRLLYGQPAALRSVRADLPESFQGLVDRMLVKDPQQRLPDAQALLEALAVLEALPDMREVSGARSPLPPPLAGAEQQLLSVLLVAPLQLEAERNALRDALRAGLAPIGVQVESLVDGSLVAALTPDFSAPTQAAQVARCALSIKQRWPEAPMVLTTGRGSAQGRLPTGEALERAGQLLRQLERLPSTSVLMDEVTAGLLGPHFQLYRLRADLFLLLSEELNSDESRRLLGRPTPCVGREQELSTLRLAFSSSVEGPAARAVLVVAPAGVGKSRLRHEFLRRLEQRGLQSLVLFARAEPVGSGSAHGLLGQALRRLCGLTGSETPEDQRTRLQERLGQHLPADKAQEVVEFLGELCGVPFPDEQSPRLRAARGDPKLMGSQVSYALGALLQAECARQPVVLVLEDLHWGDVLSVRLVDEALRALAQQPFMVLALARPEVLETFPEIWGHSLQELPLRKLTRRASAQLIREVLGSEVPESLVERLVEQAGGNALFLEESIRMAAEGRAEGPPGTVLAMLQGRLSRLDPATRQVLMAGSLFGRTFWAGGVKVLLEPEVPAEQLPMRLRQLVEDEWVEPQRSSRFPSEAEYRFRHALVRDAAYGLVPDSHKPSGHRLVGAWLEQRGESDPWVLAEHYQLGQQPERAIHFYTRSAERFFERNDLQGMLRCVEAALACGARGEAQARLRSLQALAAFWRGDLSRLQEIGTGLLSELRVGSAPWCRLIGGLIVGSAYRGSQQSNEPLSRLLLRTTPQAGATPAYLEAVAWLYNVTAAAGARSQVTHFLDRMEDVAISVVGYDPVVRGWMSFAYGLSSYFLEAQPWQALLMAEQGTQAFLEVGAERSALATRTLAGAARAALGDWDGAEARLSEALESARRLEQQFLISYVQLHLSLVLAESAAPARREQARNMAEEWVELEDANIWKRGVAHTVLARVALRQGGLAEAELHARKAGELLAPFLCYRLAAWTTLSDALRARGLVAEAREQASLAVKDLEGVGGAGVNSVAAHLALAEACLAQQDSSAGEAALRRALQGVRTRAGDIDDLSARERFLSQVPENARALELAYQRWGEAWTA